MLDKNTMVAELCQSWAHPLIHLPQWSIKLHSGSSETLQQYKVNLTAIAVHLETLADDGEVYWVLQGELRFELFMIRHLSRVSQVSRPVPFTTVIYLSCDYCIHVKWDHYKAIDGWLLSVHTSFYIIKQHHKSLVAHVYLCDYKKCTWLGSSKYFMCCH